MHLLPRGLHRALEILLVEDNADYAFLTRTALGETRLSVNIHHVDDGAKCLKFLKREAPYENSPMPDLVLLDLDMPVMDGRAVMAQIASDPALNHLAVIVLTTRDEPSEVTNMYRLRCNSYICKPAEFPLYVDLMRKVADYWSSVVELPAPAAR